MVQLVALQVFVLPPEGEVHVKLVTVLDAVTTVGFDAGRVIVARVNR